MKTSNSTASLRTIIPLDGLWQAAEGDKNSLPAEFSHSVRVPGLISQAIPPFIEPGPKVANCHDVPQKDSRRDAFWLRRIFSLEGPIPPVAMLKVRKALFGSRAILNGVHLGDHAPCFTPGYFDAKPFLRIGENELIIRIGADRDSVGDSVPSGFDCEKERYIPGIIDSVELIFCGMPTIVEVQVAPQINDGSVRVQALVRGATGGGSLSLRVTEVGSRQEVGTTTVSIEGEEHMVDVCIPLDGCRLWSPEAPFLYHLEVESDGDRVETRFGMREFHFDPVTKRAVLNGRPYFMRGSNVTIYRFFEDKSCGNLPWDEAWVRKLHRSFKGFHWNCLRYCIGFPPDFWYRIADEEGFLIQDEFPIWFNKGKWPEALKHDELVREFTEWMRERWNHPCVVLWDSCNETVSPETGLAIQAVRGLDLSDRPWDNGWGPVQRPGDTWESHVYHFSNPKFKLKDLATASGYPDDPDFRPEIYGRHPVVLNEYGWLWLNRDGSPTTLTSELYGNLLGAESTRAERVHLYARYLAAETEFWRSHRMAAAVMHFVALGYSRSNGQTSDHFLDIENLRYEPEFQRWLPDAFAPVGLMIDFWDEQVTKGSRETISVAVINDLYEPWSGEIKLSISNSDCTSTKWSLPCCVEALGRNSASFHVEFPTQVGSYTICAELIGAEGKPVCSQREIQVLP